MLTSTLLLAACGQGQTPTSSAESAATQQTLPPGFLDAAPPPPTSDTVVLSGGTLLLDSPLTDSVIVLQGGQVIAYGRRGDVDLPNDSIGRDMRGKWILPGTDPTKRPSVLTPDQPSDLSIFDEDPRSADARVTGRVRGQQMEFEF